MYEKHEIDIVQFEDKDQYVMGFSTPGGTTSPWSLREDESSDK